jgi:hypothetical protein
MIFYPVDRMSDADLQTVVRSAVVFYRVSPRHKVRIVKAVQVRCFYIQSIFVNCHLNREREQG